MRGSVRLKGKTWSYRIDLGKVDGKRKQVEKSGYKTEREALKAMNEVIYHYNHTGEYIENQKFTFQENYDQFISEEAPATRAYATIQKYESLYRSHLKEEFGPSYVYQITASQIREFLILKSKTYSQEYLKSIYKALNVLFAYAYRNKRMKKNPMDEVDPPPDPRHQREYHYLTRDERESIQKRISTTNVQVAYFIAINTGVRVSECFALRWSDVDFQRKRIHINKQLRFEDRKWCFTPLKTKNSYRYIEVTDMFIGYLRALQEQQAESRVLYGEAYCHENIVWDRREKNQDERISVCDFINIKKNGAMLTPNSEKFMAKIIRQDCGIQFKFHNLRHTYATILAENGAHPRFVQQQLGHAKFEFTLLYYTHVTDKMGQRAMSIVESEIGVPFTLGGKHGPVTLKEGILVPGASQNQILVRFSSGQYSDELHAGTNIEVWLDDHWVNSQLERNNDEWSLDGVKVCSIIGLRVKIAV